MKARLAVIAVIGLLTLSALALGFSALGDAPDVAASATAEQTTQAEGDNAAVSAFKFVCPFH